MEQVSMTCGYFDSGKTGGLQPRAALCPVNDHVFNLGHAQCGRDSPTEVIGQRGGTHGAVIAPH